MFSEWKSVCVSAPFHHSIFRIIYLRLSVNKYITQCAPYTYAHSHMKKKVSSHDYIASSGALYGPWNFSLTTRNFVFPSLSLPYDLSGHIGSCRVEQEKLNEQKKKKKEPTPRKLKGTPKTRMSYDEEERPLVSASTILFFLSIHTQGLVILFLYFVNHI